MEMGVSFKLGGNEERERKLENAQACAQELSSIECSWHGKRPSVAVGVDDQGNIKWAVRQVCCEEFKQQIAQAIQDVMPRL